MNWNLILFLLYLIFEDAWLFWRNEVFLFYKNVIRKRSGIFKKQWKHIRSALAVARSKGILFYLLIGLFWLVFLAAWCLHVNRKLKLECYYNIVLKTLGIKQTESQWLGVLWQIKKNTLTGTIGIVGIENCFNQKNNKH